MPPEEFWKLTYSEFLLKVDYYARKQQEGFNDLICLAWHVEAFARQKKLPSLDSLLQKNDNKQPHREQTDDEMMAMARLLNAAFGGEEITV